MKATRAVQRKNLFPPSSGVRGASERAQRSAREKRAVQSQRMSERCECTSERRSELPRTQCVDFIAILPTLSSARRFFQRSYVTLILPHALSRAVRATRFLIRSFTRSFARSLVHLLARAFARSLAHSHARSLSRSSAEWFLKRKAKRNLQLVFAAKT